MYYRVHNKFLSCEFDSDNKLNYSPFSMKNNWKESNHFLNSKSKSKNFSPMLSTNTSTSYPFIKNKKYNFDKEYKLSKTGYLVTNTKATNVGVVKKKIKQKLRNFIKNQEVTNEINKHDSEHSINISTHKEENDKELEEILKVSPHFKLSAKKELTIHKKATIKYQIDNGVYNPPEDFEDETIKLQAEFNQIKKEIDEVKSNNISKKYEILNILHKEARKKMFEKDKKYKELKEPAFQVKINRIIKTKNYCHFSRLSLLNENPVFTVNGPISYPMIIQDSNLLASVYNVNMFRLKNMNERNILNS